MDNLSEGRWSESIKIFSKVAENAISSFPILSPSSVVKLLNYSENATYAVEDPADSDTEYILRVSRPAYHTKSEIESELDWIKSIHEESSVKVALPIAGKESNFIQSVILENDPHEYFCTLFTYLGGEAPNEDKESELISQFEELGKVTAELHEFSIKKHSEFEKSINRLTWDYETILGEEPKWARWQDGLSITPDRKILLEKVSDTIKRRLERFGKSKERFGLIHSDLRLANILVKDDVIQVIDFDDCGFGWYLFDLGTSLSFIEDQSYVPDLIEAWIKGYRTVRQLSEEEEREIPTFIMMRRLQLISWVASRDNEFAEELGGKFSEDTDLLAKDYLQKMGSI